MGAIAQNSDKKHLRDVKKYSRDMKKYSIRHLPFDAKEGVPQTRRVCRNVWY